MPEPGPVAPETAVEPSQRIPKYKRLSRATEALILQAAESGHSQTTIAHLIGCHQGSVSKVLSQWADTRLAAKKIWNASAEKLTRAAVSGSIRAAVIDRKPEHALEALDRLEVAVKRDTGKSGVQVNVLVGECPPGLPARPVNVISSAALAVGDNRENP